ncbi:2-hydroxy-palmitic acid dioxygenase mpo1-like isoform X2 [Hibiscus syriacus]|uniref:2-hydroxy-palmitic acid dioxygenase mpo1-like isoform X2 n=1 Tax=Hibiscus syriacus TaxID=106335 RepID=UPI001921453E|nr:2-hydroxy-palmitic acid dioxygenase mpo1-like isoform X2 [Hibiscus syriacus]
MGKPRLFDLENHFAYYGAYHSNPINILIHTLFVWPIFFTSLILFYFTPAFYDLSQAGILPSGFNHALVLNYGSAFSFFLGLFYVVLDKKAGSLAAFLCLACWLGASSIAAKLGYSLAWKFNSILSAQVVMVAQVLCWSGQFLGHGVFEKRAPALLDNLVQAILMAPFFVLLEVLQSLFGYEPYPGFQARVNAKIKAEIKEWQDKKQKKVS